ncbi:hypothetical protein [Streptomyces sp. NPDC002588]
MPPGTGQRTPAGPPSRHRMIGHPLPPHVFDSASPKWSGPAIVLL